MHNINFYNLCMCTRSLAGNLSLWSIIQTLVDFSNKIQNGYVEQGMKHKSFEIYNLFKNIITFYKFSVTDRTMTNEELAELIQKTNSKSAKAILWEHNKGIIYRLARSYYRPNMPYTLEDLVQYGYFALLQAVKSYDKGKGYRFTTYLNFSFRSAIRGLNMDTYISLDTPIGDENENTLTDTIPDNSALEELEHAINITADRQAIYNALERLPQRHMEIILAYYFKGHTLKQIASSMGVTYQRVSVLQREALSKLRKDPELIEVYQDTIQNRQLKSLRKSAERPENIESRQALAMMEHRQRHNERETDFINTLKAFIESIEDPSQRMEYITRLEEYKRNMEILETM